MLMFAVDLINIGQQEGSRSPNGSIDQNISVDLSAFLDPDWTIMRNYINSDILPDSMWGLACGSELDVLPTVSTKSYN